MRLLFPQADERFLVALSPAMNYFSYSPQETQLSSRIKEFQHSGIKKKYSLGNTEVQRLIGYKPNPDKESGKSEFELLDNLLKAPNPKKIKHPYKHRFSTWFATSSILLILVLTSIVHHIRTFEIDEIFQAFYSVPPTNTIIKNQLFPFIKDWDIALNAYTREDYNQALASFGIITVKSDRLAYSAFFKGICLMQKHQYQDALEAFESVDPTIQFHNYVKWYEGLCDLKLKKFKQALTIFSELTNSVEFSKNAAEILQKLKTIN
jgi:tetratricopeptide (TPR) repeat protein